MLASNVVSAERIDPRTRRTRQLLMQAFQQLLSEKSFESITVQEIAERATVNRATFYAHFEDKYVLLDSAFAESFQQALYGKLLPGSGFNPANLLVLIQTVGEYLEQLHTHCARSIGTQFDSLVERQIQRQVHEFLLGWLRKDTSEGQTKEELRATVTSWAVYGAALYWSQGAHKESAQEFARQALPMIMAGLDAPATTIPRMKALAKV